jgi:hypothetical protein
MFAMALDTLQLQFRQSIAHLCSLVGPPRIPPYLLSCDVLRKAKESADLIRMITEEL